MDLPGPHIVCEVSVHRPTEYRIMVLRVFLYLDLPSHRLRVLRECKYPVEISGECKFMTVKVATYRYNELTLPLQRQYTGYE